VQSPLVDLQHLKVKNPRGDFVFTDLCLTIEAGKSVVVTGPAGSGKTMIAQLLAGLIRPMEGEMELFGEPVRPRGKRQWRKLRRKIGGVGGPWELIPSLSVTENVLLPMIAMGERPHIQKERLWKLLGEFGLTKVATHHPGNLTRVETMLCQIARASIAGQPLVVLDEPSSGLDNQTYLHVCEFMVKATVSGQSLLLLSSDPPPREIPASRQLRIVNGHLE